MCLFKLKKMFYNIIKLINEKETSKWKGLFLKDWKETQWFVPLDGVSGVVERVNSVMKDATTVRVVVWLMNSYWQYWKEVFFVNCPNCGQPMIEISPGIFVCPNKSKCGKIVKKWFHTANESYYELKKSAWWVFWNETKLLP